MVKYGQVKNPNFFQGCITYVCHTQGCAFTGDTLLIRGCGRTDFQEGSANTLYDSVWNHILSLPDNFKLYPAHDYKGEIKILYFLFAWCKYVKYFLSL